MAHSQSMDGLQWTILVETTYKQIVCHQWWVKLSALIKCLYPNLKYDNDFTA